MPSNDFDAQDELRKLDEDNRGIRFDEKVKESIRRSTDVLY